MYYNCFCLFFPLKMEGQAWKKKQKLMASIMQGMFALYSTTSVHCNLIATFTSPKVSFYCGQIVVSGGWTVSISSGRNKELWWKINLLAVTYAEVPVHGKTLTYLSAKAVLPLLGCESNHVLVDSWSLNDNNRRIIFSVFVLSAKWNVFFSFF